MRGSFETAVRELRPDPHHEGARREGAFDSDGLQQLGAGEAWRDDRLVVVVYEEGLSGEAGRRFARAGREAAAADRVALEPGGGGRPRDRTGRSGDRDSRLLARARFDARASHLELYRGDHLRGGGPGNEVKIDYAGDASSVTLDLWKPEAGGASGARGSGRSRGAKPASRGRGRARGDLPRPTGHWLAQVHYDDVVVAVNMPYCFACASRPATDPTTRARRWRPSCAGSGAASRASRLC